MGFDDDFVEEVSTTKEDGKFVFITLSASCTCNTKSIFLLPKLLLFLKIHMQRIKLT